MSAVFRFDPAHTAVLSMDCQAGLVSIYAQGDQAAFRARAAGVLNYARASHITVIHIKVGFRPGLPEVGSENQLFGAIKASPQHQSLFQEPLGNIDPALAPVENEIVITKHRASAFTGTDLAMILRVNDLDTLILFGISTSGVVLSTLLEACDADFRLAVIEDCCADLDADLHRALMERLFPLRATVLSTADFVRLQPA
jgi:nicotinamidase-related amidase